MTNRIRSFEQYKELTAAAKNKGYSLSNCFFLPGAVKEKILRGVLCIEEIENGLLLLEEEEEFYRCYYYLSPDKAPGRVHLEKACVIEFPFQGELKEKQNAQIEKIYEMGFSLGRESAKMTAETGGLASIPISIPVRNAVMYDIPSIKTLLDENFNPLYAFLPDAEQLKKAIIEGRVLAAGEYGRVSAVLVSNLSKRIASIEQLAVSDSMRCQGIGKQMLQAYHEKYKMEADTFQHWLDIHNTAAVKLYTGFGYQLSPRRANEYIKMKG